MATDLQAAATGRGWRPYRLTIDQFRKLIGAEVLPPDARVELLGGVLVHRMTKLPPHCYAVISLREILDGALPPDWLIREEKPIEFGRSWRPEPDLAIVKGPRELYRARTPTIADIGLLIEVSDSTYAADRGPKWRAYAAARIPSYWIVNVPARRLEVYGDPSGRGKSAGYHRVEVYGEDAAAPLMLDGREFGRVVVRDILP